MIIFFKELSCINHFHIFSYILCYNVFFYNTFQCNFLLIFNDLYRRQYDLKLNNFFCMCLKTSSFTLESLIKKKCYPMITLSVQCAPYTHTRGHTCNVSVTWFTLGGLPTCSLPRTLPITNTPSVTLHRPIDLATIGRGDNIKDMSIRTCNWLYSLAYVLVR